MSKRCAFIIGLITLMIPMLAAAAEFELNKDYKLVAKPNPSSSSSPIQVLEFFSYGCPACSTIEPTLEAWLITKPKNVEFDRVPVLFHTEWYPLAKAYYVAKNLHVVNRISPVLFNAIHKNHQDISRKDALMTLFQTQGVNRDAFEGNYDFSPSIEAQIARGDGLVRQYGIYQIPTFVVNGTYQTSLGMSAGDPKRLMKIIDFLIAQEQQKQKPAAPIVIKVPAPAATQSTSATHKK